MAVCFAGDSHLSRDQQHLIDLLEDLSEHVRVHRLHCGGMSLERVASRHSLRTVHFNVPKVPVSLLDRSTSLPKVAYLDEPDWGHAVFFPESAGHHIYTDDLNNCAVLALYLKGLNEERWYLLCHLYDDKAYNQRTQSCLVEGQVKKITEHLKERGFRGIYGMLSPRDDTFTRASEKILRDYLGASNLELLMRYGPSKARVLVTSSGWAMYDNHRPRHLVRLV